MKTKWTISVKVGSSTWTWQRDTRESATHFVERLVTYGCRIGVGDRGGYDRIMPSALGRIRVTPPHGSPKTGNDARTMELI